MRRDRKLRPTRFVVLASVAACAGGAGLATALGAGSGAAPVPGAVGGTPTLGAQARADFGVFARPEGGSDEAALAEKALTGLGVHLDPGSVRLAQESGGMQVRVAGNSESICLALRIPEEADAGGCAPTAHAASPPAPIIVTTQYPPGTSATTTGQDRAAAVLFPDGTASVVARHVDGSVSRLDISGNSVAFIAKDGDTLSWVGPEGTAYSSVIGG